MQTNSHAAGRRPRREQSLWQRIKDVRQPGRADRWLFWVFCILLVLGLATLWSASIPVSMVDSGTGDPFFYIKKQLVVVGIMLALGPFVSRVRVRFFRPFTVILFLAGIAGMVAALMQERQYDANRWLTIGSVSFQPSEPVKLVLIMTMAALLCRQRKWICAPQKPALREYGLSWLYGTLPFIFVIALFSLLMALQRHISGLILVVGICMGMMFVGGVPKYRLAAIAAVGAASVYLVATKIERFSSYILPRIETWQHLSEASSDEAYQIKQSLIAIGSGGWFGRGLGQSVQKHLYLPATINDFIFAVFCEEWGFIWAIVLVGLFTFLVVRGLLVAKKVKDRYSSLLIAGISIQIGLQFLLHIAVNTNALPCTGISLPFFSHGGTSMAILLAEVWIMLSVSRQVSEQALQNQEEYRQVATAEIEVYE